MKPQGQSSDIPGTFGTILNDVGGWRSTLAGNGLFLRAYNISSITANVLDSGGPDRPQVFNGQKPTIFSTTDVRGSVAGLKRQERFRAATPHGEDEVIVRAAS